MEERQSQSDHDLLIELRTEMRGVHIDNKALNDGTAIKLADHETRLPHLENVKPVSVIVVTVP